MKLLILDTCVTCQQACCYICQFTIHLRTPLIKYYRQGWKSKDQEIHLEINDK